MDGEHIGSQIINACNSSRKKEVEVLRARFSAINKMEINNAMLNLTEPDVRSSNAVACRQELDLRTG